MRRDSREAIQTAAVAILALILGACTLEFPGDSTVVNTATNTVSQPTPAPTGSPSPAPGSCLGAAVIASVRVNPFGFECPVGIPHPPNSSGLLPVGCVASVTATPKDLQGNDVPAELHGPDITWSIVSGAEFIQVVDFPGELFNKLVTGVSPGPFVLSASVCGRTGSWNGRVVTPTP